MASVSDLIGILKGALGIPYVYGGTTPKGFDCSGLVQWAFAKVGIKLPRTSQDQAKSGTAIPESSLSPGDLVFSDWGDGPNSHVAVYVGSGQMIEAPRTGVPVHTIALNSFYKSHVDGYRRVTSKKKGILDSIESIGGDLTSDVGNLVGGGSLGDLISFPTEMLGFYKSASGGIESVISFFGAFFRPSTYVRIGSGVIGFVFVTAGIVFLVLSGRES